ncbi:MAG: hypothetical protein DRJ08_07390 [Acidobacteria bacterium]|nr:MAG: hypothetical protein DRJ08_07390 [Acidobacteriota bacterium]
MKMRRSRFILPLLLFFCLAAATGPLKPKNFQYARTLPGPLKPGNIYRIILPGEVLNHTTIDQRDIRVFSPDETLIPFTILREHKPAVSRAQYRLKILDFNASKRMCSMILEVPATAQPIRMLFFSTPNRDFRKSISISTSDDRKNWTPLLNESIFDFSQNVDLRKTSVSFNPIKCRWFRIQLADVELPPENEAIQLNYKGLKFSSTGKASTPFRINSVTASTRARSTEADTSDTIKLTNFDTKTDAAGNTILSFSSGIPISSIAIETTNSVFYRSVSLKGERITLDRHDISLARGTFYKFSLGNKTQQRVSLATQPSDTGNYKLTIFNGDNAPLAITALRLTWVRRNLFLIPETNPLKDAVLCYGNPKVPAPHFDVARFIRPDNWEQHNSTTIKPEPPVRNTDFQQAEKPWTPEFSRIALILIVLMLAAVLAIWLWKLTRQAGQNG